MKVGSSSCSGRSKMITMASRCSRGTGPFSEASRGSYAALCATGRSSAIKLFVGPQVWSITEAHAPLVARQLQCVDGASPSFRHMWKLRR